MNSNMMNKRTLKIKTNNGRIIFIKINKLITIFWVKYLVSSTAVSWWFGLSSLSSLTRCCQRQNFLNILSADTPVSFGWWVENLSSFNTKSLTTVIDIGLPILASLKIEATCLNKY